MTETTTPYVKYTVPQPNINLYGKMKDLNDSITTQLQEEYDNDGWNVHQQSPSTFGNCVQSHIKSPSNIWFVEKVEYSLHALQSEEPELWCSNTRQTILTTMLEYSVRTDSYFGLLFQNAPLYHPDPPDSSQGECY